MRGIEKEVLSLLIYGIYPKSFTKIAEEPFSTAIYNPLQSGNHTLASNRWSDDSWSLGDIHAARSCGPRSPFWSVKLRVWPNIQEYGRLRSQSDFSLDAVAADNMIRLMDGRVRSYFKENPMTKTELSPKAAKKQQTILEIALKVFAKEGFRNTDVQVIADLAGVGKGTIYRYFGNKEQLFLATAKHCLTQAGAFIQQQVVGQENPATLPEKLGAIAILRKIAVAYATFYERHPEAIEIMIQERSEFRESVFPSHLMHRAETRQELDTFLRAAIERGEIRDVNVDQATNAFADLLFGSVVNGCLEGGKSKLVDRVENAIELFLSGLAVPSSK